MPKARTAKIVTVAGSRRSNQDDLYGLRLCHRPFCSAHGVPDLEQCTKCLEASEETE